MPSGASLLIWAERYSIINGFRSIPSFRKQNLLGKKLFRPKWRWANFYSIYFGLKYKDWVNLKRIGLIVFAVTLGPHKDNIQTDRYFLKNIIFGLEKPKNVYFFLKIDTVFYNYYFPYYCKKVKHILLVISRSLPKWCEFRWFMPFTDNTTCICLEKLQT